MQQVVSKQLHRNQRCCKIYLLSKLCKITFTKLSLLNSIYFNVNSLVDICFWNSLYFNVQCLASCTTNCRLFSVLMDITFLIELNIYWSMNISYIEARTSSFPWATGWRISPDVSILVFHLSALHCTLLSAVCFPSHPIAKTSLGYSHLLYVLESYFVVRFARTFEWSVRKIYM